MQQDSPFFVVSAAAPLVSHQAPIIIVLLHTLDRFITL